MICLKLHYITLSNMILGSILAHDMHSLFNIHLQSRPPLAETEENPQSTVGSFCYCRKRQHLQTITAKSNIYVYIQKCIIIIIININIIKTVI